jgi:hypothetical protein
VVDYTEYLRGQSRSRKCGLLPREQMQIRREQMNGLRAWAEGRADARLVEYLRGRFPSSYASAKQDDLLDFVRSRRERAHEYGIEREENVADFLDFVTMYGDGFPHQPWALDVISSGLHGPDKMALLRRRVEETGVRLRPGA